MWKNLSKHFGSWCEQAPRVVHVICALLCKTKAWTVFDQTTPNLEPESLASVAVALQSLGVDDAFIADAWQEKLLDKYIRLAEANSAKISEMIVHLLQECVDGVFQ